MNLNDFKSWLQSLPIWLRAFVIAVIAVVLILVSIFGTSSCSVVRATVNAADGRIATTVQQSVLDSNKVTLTIGKN